MVVYGNIICADDVDTDHNEKPSLMLHLIMESFCLIGRPSKARALDRYSRLS